MTAQTDHVVNAFIDLRSPYSYLVLQPARSLAERSGTTFEWWPYITDFHSAYGGDIEQRTKVLVHGLPPTGAAARPYDSCHDEIVGC